MRHIGLLRHAVFTTALGLSVSLRMPGVSQVRMCATGIRIAGSRAAGHRLTMC